MAEFECKVYKIDIEEHPNADAIELAKVGEFRSIVRKGQFNPGDLAVYIPEASIVPRWMLESLGLWDEEKNKGKLAGKNGDRLKAVRLRGVISQGLIYPVEGNTLHFKNSEGDSTTVVDEGQDVTELLGIKKWEPPIPVHMAGEVRNIHGKTLSFDIENWKKYPDILKEGEDVVFTEKIHGTWCCIGYHPDVEGAIVSSKGLSSNGLAFKLDTERNDNNLYVRVLRQLDEINDGDFIKTAVNNILGGLFDRKTPFYILGEVFGRGVQDLQYGADSPLFRVFDIYVGKPGEGYYLNYSSLVRACKDLNLKMVPLLYWGRFSVETMKNFTDGNETVSGNGANIREGIVMKPSVERRDLSIGRVCLKSVSDNYLARKGKVTEYN